MKTEKQIATTTTVTYALMAERTLAENGIKSRIVRPPEDAVARGCAYGIEFDRRERRRVKERLDRAGIRATVY